MIPISKEIRSDTIKSSHFLSDIFFVNYCNCVTKKNKNKILLHINSFSHFVLSSCRLCHDEQMNIVFFCINIRLCSFEIKGLNIANCD